MKVCDVCPHMKDGDCKARDIDYCYLHEFDDPELVKETIERRKAFRLKITNMGDKQLHVTLELPNIEDEAMKRNNLLPYTLAKWIVCWEVYARIEILWLYEVSFARGHGHTCAFCREGFYSRGGTCAGCPVQEKTGRAQCCWTPWDKIDSLTRQAGWPIPVTACKSIMDACNEEVRFLLTLK